MSYAITKLSPNFFYITLTTKPTAEEDKTYVSSLQKIITEAPEPVYFLMDFRQHITSEISTIVRLSELAKHKNFGFSAAFSSDRIRKVYSTLFTSLSKQQGPKTMFESAEGAIEQLEQIKPGLTENIDLKAIIK